MFNKLKKFKKKGLILAIISGVLVIPMAISGLVYFFGRKNKSNENTDKPKSSISTIDLSDLGNELDIPKETKAKYGDTTGNIDKDTLVEQNGKIYIDKESADKSDKVGNVYIDTKDDTLIVKPDGTVVEKEEGYEIIDEDGKIIESGEGQIPEDFEYNEQLDGIYEKEDKVEGFVYADSNYYNEEGNLVIEKGVVVSKETLEYAKKYLSTTKVVQSTTKPDTSTQPQTQPDTSTQPQTQPTTKPDTSTQPQTQPETQPTTSNNETNIDEGIINEDGTYTIFGLTFLSKADYQQWVLQGYEGYGEVYGIMQADTEEMKQAQKVK